MAYPRNKVMKLFIEKDEVMSFPLKIRIPIFPKLPIPLFSLTHNDEPHKEDDSLEATKEPAESS